MVYLSKSDWQKHLKLKDHSAVKKTGISEVLSDYEKAVAKADRAAQVLALEKLRDTIDEVKAKWAALGTLTSYLDGMKKEAKAAADRIGNELEKAAEADELDGVNSTLADALVKLRKATADQPSNFALAPGNPSTGLCITHKSLSKTHVKRVLEMRGKPGPYFTGTCFYASSKYIFQFPQQPARGLATAIKQAARLHAEMNVSVVVRGGGVEFDDTADSALGQAGEIKTASGGAAKYPTADKLDAAIDKVRQLPVEQRQAALSGLVGWMQQLKKQAAGDVDLQPGEQVAVTQVLDAALGKAQQMVQGTVNPTATTAAKYPLLPYWSELIERCLRIDEAKRVPAVAALRKRLAEVDTAVQQDQELTEPDRLRETATIAAVKRRIIEQFRGYMQAVDGADVTNLKQRLRDLETEFDIARKQRVLPGDILTDVGRAILAAREALASGGATASAEALDSLEVKVKAAVSISYEENARGDRLQQQGRIHASVKDSINLFKKGAFAAGTADAMFRNSNEVQIGSSLKKLGDDFRKCEQDPSPQNLAALSNQGQAFLTAVAKAKSKLDPGKDASKLQGLGAQEKLARQAVQRVRLLELANEMDAIGPPAWNDAQQERMAELQVSFFFEEGAIKQGVAEFGAPQLGDPEDNQGVNEAWWIKRVDAKWGQIDPNDPDQQKKIDAATKTYIFKAQDLEATEFPGIPKNGGAAREVLASKLSDTLVASGFDIGVCPTHMVQIDSAKLGNLAEPSGPRTFGAVQELAANKGPISKELKKDAAAFGKTLSHKNCSDIAAFDLMFLNLDRHAGNLLVQEQPDGSNKLVPIDHGIGLPDADGLALNRFRVRGAQNTMVNEELHTDELMDTETRANLQKIDARAMTAALKQQQAESEARHPEAKGKVDPTEFDRMARRIEFMQAAGDILTAREMTQAIASYSKQIQAAEKNALPQLARQLKTKLVAVNEGNRDLAALMDMKASFPTQILTDLGWGVGMGGERLQEWASENADFVARILKAKIRNPSAIEEISRLATRINDPALEKEINSLPMGKQLSKLRSEVEKLDGARKTAELRQLPEGKEARLQLLSDLGGKQGLADVVAAYPKVGLKTTEEGVIALRLWQQFKSLGGADELKKLSASFPSKPPDSLSEAVARLTQWSDFNALGGIRAYLDMGGMGDTLSGALVIFRELKRIQDGDHVNKTLQIDPRRIEEEQRKIVDHNLRTLDGYVRGILTADKSVEFQQQVQEIRQLIQTGAVAAAQGKTEHLLPKAATQSAKEANEEQELMEELRQLREVGRVAKQSQPELDLSAISRAAAEAERHIAAHAFKTAKNGLNKIDLDLDQMVKGADSKAAKFAKQIQEVTVRINQLQEQPGAVKARTRWTNAQQSLTTYDVGAYQSGVNHVLAYLDVLPRVARIETATASFQGDASTRERLDKLVVSMRSDLDQLNGTAVGISIKNAAGDLEKVLPATFFA